MSQVTKNLDILFQNLSLGIRLIKPDTQEVPNETFLQLQATAKNIYDLSHLAFFTHDNKLNKESILTLLVQVMSNLVKKETIHVEL